MSFLKPSVFTSPAHVPTLGHVPLQTQLYRQPTRRPDHPRRSVSAVSANPTRICTFTSCKPTIPAMNSGNLFNTVNQSPPLPQNPSTATTPHPWALPLTILSLNIPTARAPLQHLTTTPAPATTSTQLRPILPSHRTPALKAPPVPTIGATTKARPPSPASHRGSSASTVIPTPQLVQHDKTICQLPLQSLGMTAKLGTNPLRTLHDSQGIRRGEMVV